ncbi:PAS domain S-box protein [Okeanomitos corallinicola TIOX110]|uniref:histidine kinase n=1 Tax=Okeanomitos corallinicola TIOX110 TaxID=3133117 RepID=A0ABZ2UV24_9CYAN
MTLPNLHKLVNHHPLTISSDSCAIEAIMLMDQEENHSLKIFKTLESLPKIQDQQKATGCVCVVEQRKLLGIFTARDVIRLIASGRDISKIKIAEVMVQQPITIKESELLDCYQALSIFRHYEIHHLPIVDDRENLVGIVTESALLQELNLVELCSALGSFLEYNQGKNPQPFTSQHTHLQNQQREINADQIGNSLQKKQVGEEIQEIKEIKVTEELEQTIEELQVVEEEICQQNEQILVASQIADLERQRYYNLFELTPYGYLITSKLGIIEEANQAASTLLSVDQKYLVGKPLQIFITQKEHEDFISQLADTQQIQEWEIYLQPRQGKIFPASVRVTSIYNTQGQHTGWSWLISDISKNKQTETALRKATEELRITNQALQQEIQEHQETEAAIIKSEGIFRQFGENIQAHIWICTKDCSEILYVNPAYEKIWGRSCQSLVENPISWIEAIHPEDRDQTLATIEKYHQNDEGANLEYRIVHPHQSVKWLWVRCFPIKNEQGEILYFGGIAEDITERKLAEQSFRESESRLNIAIETAQIGIWEKKVNNPHKCIWSDSIGPLYGLLEGSLCPPHEEFFKLIYPEDHHILRQAISNSIEKGEEFTIEYRVVWPDDSIHWLSSTGKTLYNQEGEPLKIIGTSMDISDRKHKEQKLHEQAELLDIATDAIFVRDFQTEIVFWNKGAEKIYGWSKDEAIGSNLHDLLYGNEKISPRQEVVALKDVVKLGTWHGELRKQTKCGQDIIVESRWSLMLDNDGQPKSILIVDTDITKKKELEEQFYRNQRVESIGTLAGGIAHDLNNILSPILISAQLLKGKFAQDTERHLQMLNIIENNARRGSYLVKQVLSFTRGLKGERTTVQVKHLITEILNFAKRTFPKSIEFTTQIPEHLGTVFGDSTQLHQVLMNLVVNARDAMAEGGILKIVAENMFIDEAYSRMHIEAKEGHYIVITVADTGVGIPAEILDRIFERFFTTKEVGHGTGFGLSTVQEIITNHNGFVTVSSQVGKGSTFKVFLPSVESPELPTLEELDISPGQGELILIVDDEPQIIDLNKIILENNNYRVLTASNGFEAIDIYKEHKHDISLVLIDMMMPEMDGVTAIRTLQKINPDVKVIACSGSSSIDLLPKSAEIKVEAVLLKPYNANELLMNLNQVIGNC